MKCGYNAHLLGQVCIVVVLTPLMLIKTLSSTNRDNRPMGIHLRTHRPIYLCF
jgi:hypothetical protein